MSILFVVLLYVLCIAWLCALTGVNRLDDYELKPRRVREHTLSKATAPPARVPAREAHG